MSNTLFNFNITINRGLIFMETLNILIEALPYIKKFYQKKIIIKYRGHAMINTDQLKVPLPRILYS